MRNPIYILYMYNIYWIWIFGLLEKFAMTLFVFYSN